MSQFLVLSHIKVQNANSIAGLTWGFPSITQFLGFTHALNRKFSNTFQGEYPTELIGCAVIANQTANKVYQPKPYADFEFLQSKNPPVLAIHKAKSPPIIEEGKLNLTVSLIFELSQPLSLTSEKITALEAYIDFLCQSMRIAGGSVLEIKNVKLLSASSHEQKLTLLNKVKRLCMPGFILQDRSAYLEQHLENLTKQRAPQNAPTQLEAWLDFSALKSVAASDQDKNKDKKKDEKQGALNEEAKVEWHFLSKPFGGYLVPLMVGYKAIDRLYEKHEIKGIRAKPTDDDVLKVCFVEAVHSVGEWRSLQTISSIEKFIWRYKQEGDWYLCQQRSLDAVEENNQSKPDLDLLQNDINAQIANLF